MSRSKWLLTVSLLVAAITLFSLYPRFGRVIAYRDLVTGSPASSRLAIRPLSIEPHLATKTETIDTNYSQFAVPAAVFTQLDSLKTWLKLHDAGDRRVLLTEPHYDTQFSADGNYTFFLQSLHEQPLSSWQVFMMSEADYSSHWKRITAKLATTYADRDVSFFQTSHTKGIIRYGSTADYPDVINLIIWDNVHPISQELIVTIPYPQLREMTAQSIAASYCFTLHVVPPRETLLQLAREASESFTAHVDP
ncbi:MAG: hypothetical protein C0478_18060 [Planctomyces sp.]|nr:hypothetical protein [Planctomyces sp.]